MRLMRGQPHERSLADSYHRIFKNVKVAILSYCNSEFTFLRERGERME